MSERDVIVWAAIRQGMGSKTSGALLELGIDSYVKLRILIPAARSLRAFSGNRSAWLVSYGIHVAVGEAGWGKWEEGGSGILVNSIVNIELRHLCAEV
jgi:hypothetical protein